jgi:hypothetical protein
VFSDFFQTVSARIDSAFGLRARCTELGGERRVLGRIGGRVGCGAVQESVQAES